VRIKVLEPGANGCYVFLDGERVDDAVEADDSEGWVDVIAHDERGHMIPDDENGTHEVERLTGLVLIRFTAEARALRKSLSLPVPS
jgi:type VI protein secretion system component Hcp